MRYSDITTSIISSVEAGDTTPTYISGPPGTGKTSISLDVAERFGLPREVAEQCIFRPSLHDPVDLLGVPFVEGEGAHASTRWASNSFLSYVNDVAEQYGTAVLTWDELPQGVPMMQNAIAGLLLDRRLGDFALHPNVVQIATGNRTQDKAGANRMLTQVANRMEHVEHEVHVEDWADWAMQVGVDPVLVGFIRFRPDLLHDFDPDRMENATPRSWAAASKVSTDLPAHIYRQKVAGRVGAGPAAEYIGFREIYQSLPDRKEILGDPQGAPVPEDVATKYATVTMLVNATTEKTIEAAGDYVQRLGSEYDTLYHHMVGRKDDSLRRTQAWIRWATERGIDALW